MRVKTKLFVQAHAASIIACGGQARKGWDRATVASAANPKFAPQLPRVRLRTSGSKRHSNHRFGWCPSIPKFASERAAKSSELRNRDTSVFCRRHNVERGERICSARLRRGAGDGARPHAARRRGPQRRAHVIAPQESIIRYQGSGYLIALPDPRYLIDT